MKRLLSLALCSFLLGNAYAQTPNLQAVTEAGATTNQTISLSSDLFFTSNFMGIHFRKSGQTRWYLRHDTNESGGNTGSDFSLYSYNDAGGSLRRNLFINRATGLFSIDGEVQTAYGITGKVLTFQESTGYIGMLGQGVTMTSGWSATPNVYALTYLNRDFAIGGSSKTTGTWQGAALYINSDNGNVMIGKVTQANATYKLDVAGKIRADKLVVNTTGADFVFDPSYSLIPLPELGKYIKEHRHLPGIEPATAMQQNGLDVGDNQTKLLQKIEELTLYLLELNKKVEEQAKELKELKKK